MGSSAEYELLARYRDGNTLSTEDTNAVYTLASMGLMRLGFTDMDGEAKETAMLTSLGKDIYKEERSMRNPVRKLLYFLTNI